MTTLEIKVNGSLIGIVMVLNMKLIREGLYQYEGKYIPLVLEDEEKRFKVRHYKKDGILVLYRKVLEKLTD